MELYRIKNVFVRYFLKKLIKFKILTFQMEVLTKIRSDERILVIKNAKKMGFLLIF